MTDLVLRAPGRVQLPSGGYVNTIFEHDSVVKSQGRVLLGKFGMPLGPMPLRALENGPGKQRSQLIVVTKNAGVFSGVASPVEEAFTGALKNEQRRFVPAYYSVLDIKPYTWFLLSGLFRPICLNRFILSSNARPLLDVIAETRTVAMLVQKAGA